MLSPEIRVRRVPLPGRATPAAVLAMMAADAHPVVLSGAWLAPDPAAPDHHLTILGSEPTRRLDVDGDPFACLDDLPAVGANPDGARVGGGWVGWLGYGLGALAEPGVLGPAPPPALTAPPFSLAYYDHLIVHGGEAWWFESLETDARAGALAERLALWGERVSAPPVPPVPTAEFDGPELAPVGAGPSGHRAAVAACREWIAAGDLYQANLTFGLAGVWEGDPLELFARALESAPPRFGAVIGGPAGAVVSLSPERFLRRDGATVWSEPMKGTRPRSGDPAVDAEAVAELEASEKDRAEHVMIVDLVRNDLGRVCEYTSVQAAPLRAEPHPGVWQLVSTVGGRLRPAVTNAELLAASFPPGSVTGAPKIAAMAAISELESTRREAYTGAIGIASPVAGLDLNVAIRTFEITPGRIWLGVGGGIVADSEPADELAEALAKAAGPLAAIGGRLLDRPPLPRVPARRFSWRPRTPEGSIRPRGGERMPPRALELTGRPDSAEGVFETLLATAGKPQFVAAHIARLQTAALALYDVELPADLTARVSVAGAGMTRARVRVRVGPDGQVHIHATPEPRPQEDALPLRLAPWLLPGGLGAQKWADRRLQAALGAARPDTVPLLIDGDAHVLEAGHANVWIVEGEEWITPPADGRILPGVTRAAMLANPGLCTVVESFDLDRLAHADAVYLSSSVSGRRRATLAGGPGDR